jgi:hypothetical protein
MISDPKIAAQISEVMQSVFRQVDESVALVRQNCSDEETAAYLKATAPIVGGIVMDVMEPLYKKNPSLKLKGWDD